MKKNPKVANEPIISIAIPVYNEENTIYKILKRVIDLPIDNFEIIVIDDASQDNSFSVINNVKQDLESSRRILKVIKHEKNLGKGAGIKTALNSATGLYFVVQDADLEYRPEDIVKLLKEALINNYDVVYGSRFKGKIENMPKPNYYANKFYNILISKLYGVEITDMHTCFKLVKTKLMLDFQMHSDGFDYATELVSKILKRKIIINEVPITFNGRTKKEGKKINYKDGFDCIYKIFKYRYTKSI